MKSLKSFAAIIVFIGTFAASSGLVWLLFGFPATESASKLTYQTRSENIYAADIEAFLTEDIDNGWHRDRHLYESGNLYDLSPAQDGFSDFALTMENYADNSGNLDATEMPSDFQKAWNKHMKAWRDYSDFLSAVNNKSTCRRTAKSDFNQMQKGFDEEISRTWDEVLRVGRKYGANVRAY